MTICLSFLYDSYCSIVMQYFQANLFISANLCSTLIKPIFTQPVAYTIVWLCVEQKAILCSKMNLEKNENQWHWEDVMNRNV